MNKRWVSLALVAVILLIPLLAAAHEAEYVFNAHHKPKKLGFVAAHGQIGRTKRTGVFGNILGNVTLWGYEYVVIEKPIAAADLADVDFLFMGSVFGKNVTDGEIAAIKEWFNQGGKAIWVGADSDFGGGYYIQVNTNKILEAINSKIRAEPTQVLDPKSNALADYRVVAPVINPDPAVSELTAGVKKLLFHGPTILAGVKDGKWVPLETESVPNVYWVVKTSEASTIVDQDLVEPKAHKNGDKGSFVILAVEKYAGPKGDGKIIVSGGDPYGDYEPIFQWRYYGVDLDGPQFLKNAIAWGLKVERAPTFLEQYWWLIAAAVIVIIAVVAVVVARRRKPKAG